MILNAVKSNIYGANRKQIGKRETPCRVLRQTKSTLRYAEKGFAANGE